METIGRHTVAAVLIFAVCVIVNLAFWGLGYQVVPNSPDYWRGLVVGWISLSIWGAVKC
jgi:hypothetical protein